MREETTRGERQRERREEEPCSPWSICGACMSSAGVGGLSAPPMASQHVM